MQAEGLIIRGIGDAICFCPPLIITEAQVTEMFAIARAAMDAVAAERG